MTEVEIIDALLRECYDHESFALETALKSYTGENNLKMEAVKQRLFKEVLIEKTGKGNNVTHVKISLHAKNLVDAGGYFYFYGDETTRNQPFKKMPQWTHEVSGFQYYLFWPVFFIAIMEAAFIVWKLLD